MFHWNHTLLWIPSSKLWFSMESSACVVSKAFLNVFLLLEYISFMSLKYLTNFNNCFWQDDILLKPYVQESRNNALCDEMVMTLSTWTLKMNMDFRKSKTYIKHFFKTIIEFEYLIQRTTDAQRGSSLHCTVEYSIPIPNF